MMGTIPVRFEVLGVEPVRGAGRLVGLAVVLLDVGGVEVTLQGVQVLRDVLGGLTVQAPRFRHPRDGRHHPAVLLPIELRDAIGAEVLAAIGGRVTNEAAGAS